MYNASHVQVRSLSSEQAVAPSRHALFASLSLHAPSLHSSFAVHARPSSQAVPSLTSFDTQSPLSESHAAVWQSSLALHSLALPPSHLPLLHDSPLVQASPSSQSVPFASFAY